MHLSYIAQLRCLYIIVLYAHNIPNPREINNIVCVELKQKNKLFKKRQPIIISNSELQPIAVYSIVAHTHYWKDNHLLIINM